MASSAQKTVRSDLAGPPTLPPEGPELDRLIKARVAEADANPAPGLSMEQVFNGLRNRHAQRAARGA